MRKLIKLAAVAALTASVACFSSAATIMDTGFRTSDTPAYSDGNLAGQNGWADVTNSIGANAFNVNDSSVTGFASTVGITLSTNVGNTVYYTNSFLNAVNEELSGSLDFNVSSTFQGINGGDVFRLGISTTVTNNLSGASNQVFLAVNSTAAGIIKIQSKEGTNAASTLCQLSALQSGWSATEVPLPVTDTLRLTWKIRKTVAGDTYMLSASLTNLLAASTNSVGHAAIMRAEAYATNATYFMMMHSAGSLSSNNTGYSDISIDNLSITNESEVAPVLYPSTVYSDSGSSQVILNWNLAAEATGCYIERSWNGTNGYSTIASDLPGTTITYTDTTVTNGESYYYRVTWTALGASPVSSADVLGEPNDAKTGLIFDSSFRSTDSPAYANGDLAGQNKWKSITASGAPAFYVDSTGNGFAETAPYSNYFDNVNGNQVYYNQTMSNGVSAAWSGTTVFTLKATPELTETKITTNTVDDVVTVTTNIQQVAFMPNGRVFELGITSDPTAVLNPNDKKYSALITGRSTTSGGFNVLLNGYNATVNLMIEVPRANLGWDPEWSTTNATPDFETDPITLNWEIRKSVVTSVYAGSALLTVGTNSYTGSVQFTDETTTQPVNLWTNPLVRFAMSHSFAAQASSTSTMVNVSIDSLSLSHTNTAPIMNAAPFALSGVVGNTNILLSWQGALEATGFDVYRSVGYSNANYQFRGSTTNIWSYSDTNLTDLVLYNYKVVAKYATTGSSNTSDSISIRARAKVDYLVWDAAGKVAGNENIAQTNKVVVTNVNGSVVANIYGYGTNGAIVAPGIGTYSGIPVYGVVQVTGSLNVATLRMTTTAFEEVSANKGLTASNKVSALIYIPATNGAIDMTANGYAYEYSSTASANIRAAFRDGNSGKWYVSDNNTDTNGNVGSTSRLTLDDMAGSTNQWRVLTITTDTLMCGTNNPVTVPDFTAVNAIGFMADRLSSNFKPTLLKISAVAQLPTCAITTTTNDIHPGVYISPTNPVVNYGDSPSFVISGGTNGFRVATLKTNGYDVVDDFGAVRTFDNTNRVVNWTWYNVTSPTGSLEATYTEIFYTLAVTNGTGDGMVVTNVVVTNEVGMVVTNAVSTGAYTNGVAVNILANTAPAGKVFTYWTGNTNYLVATNVFAASNTVIMKTKGIQLTANYTDIVYPLTVNRGSGDGSWTNGQLVEIIADPPEPGEGPFFKWTGATQYVGNVFASNTWFTMPANGATVTATYVVSEVTLTGIVVGVGGTISPTSTNVAIGTNVTFVLTANTDYRISTLTKNGTDVPGVTFDNLSTSYNFIWTNVQAAGTASVSFVAQTTTVSTVPFVPVAVPYSWLRMQGITNNQDAAVALDQDGDGVKTWAEWIAGTVPTNSLSVLKGTQTTVRSNLNVITWNSVTGRLYQVYWSTNLVKGFALKQDNITYPTNNATASYTNASPDSRVNHYQVRVRFQ